MKLPAVGLSRDPCELGGRSTLEVLVAICRYFDPCSESGAFFMYSFYFLSRELYSSDAKLLPDGF